jgi:hypothetical protein
MKKAFLDSLKTRIDQFLEDCDEADSNHEFVYPQLADDMAKAAALVYDACQAGQKFERSQRCSE